MPKNLTFKTLRLGLQMEGEFDFGALRLGCNSNLTKQAGVIEKLNRVTNRPNRKPVPGTAVDVLERFGKIHSLAVEMNRFDAAPAQRVQV